MKIKYLGTAAAEGIPALFCNCRVCKNALDKKGKEIKTRSQALIDDKILIDFPADTYMHMLNFGVDLKNIHHLIITHSHHDHLYENDLWCRKKGIANEIDETPLKVYVTESGYEIIKNSRFNLLDNRMVCNVIEPFKPFFVEDYKIIPLKAAHDLKATPVIYIIEHNGKSLLYANDTGIFPKETWDFLENYNKCFDLISLDCTALMISGGDNLNHMSLEGNKQVTDKLLNMGLICDNTIIYINHFSHNGKATHYEAEQAAEKYGYKVTYDGLSVEI